MTTTAPTPPVQTYAVGKSPVAAKYPSLGFTGEDLKPRLSGCVGMLVGIPGSGKSAILQSCPDAYIFNLDLSPTVTTPQATIWPGLDRSGRVIDVGRKPMELTWAEVSKKIDLLILMAEKNLPRPEAICFDSVAGLFRVLKPAIAKKYKKDDFSDCGEAGWKELNSIVSNLPFRLKKWGYGVWYCCHLTKKFVQLSQDYSEPVPELTITDTLFKQLHPAFDIVAPVKMSIEETRKERTVNLTDAAGNVLGTETVTDVSTKEVHWIDFGDPQLMGITKGRNIRGRLQFDLHNGWATFENAYRASNPDAYT